MVDPKNYREVAIDLAAFKREVDPQFAHLNKMVHWILTVVIGAAVSGGFAIYTLTATLQVSIATLSESVAELKAQVKRVEEGATRGVGSMQRVSETLDRIELRITGDAGPFAPLLLVQDEEQVIREFLGVKGPITGTARFLIGDPVPPEVVKPIPELLSAKLPKLKGAKYTFSNGYAIIVGAGNRVVAIIAPA